VLVLDTSDWISWDLYGRDVWRPALVYTPQVVPRRPEKAWDHGQPYDLDLVTADTLNRMGSVITARNAAGSAPPPGLEVLRRTPSFVLWGRVGTVPAHGILREGWHAGAVLDCTSPGGARLRHRAGWALVRPAPVVATAPGWRGTAADAGSRATRTLRLPPGRWDLALQYVSRTPLRVRAGDVDHVLPGNLDRMGQLFALGTVSGGAIPVTVHALAPTGLAGVLGARLRTFALDSLGHQPLGAIVATRHGARPQRIRLSRACGRYVDRYTLDP
jgi:hypothetical protein